MGKLEDDFPELNAPRSKRVQVFRIGEEPPEWVEWADKTPQERLRAAELLRRVAYGYDPDTAAVSRSVEIIRRQRR